MNNENHNSLTCRVTKVVAQPFVNRVLHSDFLNNELPDKCAQLIIADPPYFEVKGEFDFIWKSFDDYLKDVEKWAIECKRILAENGTLLWWGDKKKIAYTQIILDKYFNLENSLIWRKIDSMQYQYYSPDLARTFNTHNERILMYVNSYEFSPFAELINMKMKELNLKEIDFRKLRLSKNGQPTGWMSNILLGKNMPTKEDWETIETLINSGKDYNELAAEYENKRRFFYNPLKLEEVLEFSQEAQITKNYDHETKKPETLTRALILTCSKPNDLVVVPFSGSGTECAMAIKENRKAVGFDINSKYVEMSNARIKKIVSAPTLF